MLSEISKNDIKEIHGAETPNYRNIKPESGMSKSEADKYWDRHFDDNGNEYRVGNKLEPNAEFEQNEYHYETDEKGRIVSAEGKLKMRDPNYKRNMENVRKIASQEYKDTDDRGHLIGHQFGGSDKLENLVPMDAKLNKGDFAKLENTLADAVKDGADVRMKVEPVYEGNSTRPSEFRVSYSIDGEKDAVIFKNRSDD